MTTINLTASEDSLRQLKELYGDKLDDPVWRITSGELYKIIIKGDKPGDDLVIPFKPNRAQRRFMKRMHHRNVILKARQLGFCVAPETRVLTADLRWVPISDLTEGAELVAVDEHPPGGRGKARRMRTATVQAAARVHRMAYRISFDDGRSVVCTDRHPWLSKKAGDLAEWRSLSGEGNSVVGRLKVGTKVRWVAKPWEAPSFEDGWIGGMIDGEGSMALPNSSGAEVNVSQVQGPAFARMEMYLSMRGYSYRTESDMAERPSKFGKSAVDKLCVSRMDEIFRLIGQTRPIRFLGRKFWEGKELPGKRNGDVGWAAITNIEPLGEQEMIDLQTSTGTYIAEGFVSHNTTLIAIIWLDHALWVANSRCGIIAQDKDAAEIIFRDKVKFAYENLPELFRMWAPLAKDSASELMFAHNNSSVRVATSMRSGTLHRLHVSEFGKICAKYPDKAKEVMTGSIPAVPTSGVLVVESTAEGAEGEFFDMTQRAIAQDDQGAPLNPKDYRLHFYAWWDNPEYTINPEGVIITDRDHEYFDRIEATCDIIIRAGQRAWYVATRDADYPNNPERMWQEYPSTQEEAFQQSTEGCWYATQMAVMRKAGRICTVPEVDAPVNTFWDIGNSDGCAIWFHQRVGLEHRFIRYYEEFGEDLRHYVKILQDTGYIFGKHFLPHDAEHKRLSDDNRSVKEILEGLGVRNIEIVPRITNITTGIGMTRAAFTQCWIDETNCKQGIKRLDNYRKRWSPQQARYLDEPVNDHTQTAGPDALRQWAQALDGGMLNTQAVRKTKTKARSWRTA